MISRLESRIDEVRQLAAQGLPWKVIGSLLRINKEGARRFAKRHGIAKVKCLAGRRPLQERIGSISVIHSAPPIAHDGERLRRKKEAKADEKFGRAIAGRAFASFLVPALPHRVARADCAEGLYATSLVSDA